MLINKTILGLTLPYLRYLLQPSSSTYNTHSASHILLKVPKAHTYLGCSSIQFAAASNSNELQKTFKLDSFISISTFKDSIMEPLTDSSGWFAWCSVVSTFLPFVLLSVSSNVYTMFCAANILCCHVLLPSYIVVLGLYVVLCCLSCCDVFCPIFILYLFFILYPRRRSPQEVFCLLVGRHCKYEFVLNWLA